jgi:translation initiation factor IF-2
MGHIDHGKSTLLDYIRKSNVVDGEAGGITQHLSAYVVNHTTSEGKAGTITFLDTPGHAAFQKMRLRGADVADIAILIVSAEDGVKPQTLEALEAIKTAGIPMIVAINKIDKPEANIMRTQTSLIEHEIYIEGMGGDIPWVGISAKSGEGISELLDLVMLTADLAELTATPGVNATGVVLEGAIDGKRGTSATLMVQNGTLKSGQFVVTGTCIAPVRIMEDHTGNAIKEAGPATPVRVIGFSDIPKVGDTFITVGNKKEAEKMIESKRNAIIAPPTHKRSVLPTIPILIKADALGTLDAIVHELDLFTSERICVRVIDASVGPITDSDVQAVSATKEAIIVGFNVKIERSAKDLADKLGVEIDTFSIIYELSEWLNTALKNRTPKIEEKVTTGKVKILKHFSTQKHTHVLGGRIEEGVIKLGQFVRILRRDIDLGKGIVKNLQQQKSDVKQVNESEFGMQIDSRIEIAPGDILESYELVTT